MKSSLQAGVSTTAAVAIDRERTIDFMGEKVRVYSTPMVLFDVEVICRDLLLQHLDAGENSVGTRVELDHTGATLMGMKVTMQARIAEVNGRAVTFEVSGNDGIEDIFKCRHQRFVVDVAKTEQRLAAKAQKAGLA